MATPTEPISYSVSVPAGSIVTVWPPDATTTTTDPVTPGTPARAFQDDSTVAFQVPSGGGNLLLGNATRVGYTIVAGEERAVDLRGSTNRISGRSSAGTIVVEVFAIA